MTQRQRKQLEARLASAPAAAEPKPKPPSQLALQGSQDSDLLTFMAAGSHGTPTWLLQAVLEVSLKRPDDAVSALARRLAQ